MNDDNTGSMEITANYLPTQEDYVCFQLAFQKQAVVKSNIYTVRIAGFFMVLFGIVFFAFLGGGLYNKLVWILLVFAGLCTFFYYDMIQPPLIEKQAKSGYAAQKRRLLAQTVVFKQDVFTVQTDLYEAVLPYKMLYSCVEDEKLFLLYTGKNEVRFVPKRAMTAKECETVRARLQGALGVQYKSVLC